MNEFIIKYFSGLEPLAMNVGKLVTAAIILLVGWLISIWAKRLVQLALSKTDDDTIEATVRPLLGKLTKAIILIVTILMALSKLGVPISSLIAVVAAAGLAIGLALQGTLSNIASGIMLLFLKPLRINEYIETPNASGTVIEVGLFTTILRTVDGLYISCPNAQIWGNRVQNFDRYTTRRVSINIGVAYDSNLEKVKDILLKVMNDYPGTLQEPSIPEVFVDAFGDSSINFTARCWLPKETWRLMSTDLRIAIKQAFDDSNIEIPFPQRVIHQKTSET